MRFIEVSLIASLAVACTTTSPLSPSTTGEVADGWAEASNVKAAAQKVIVYFYDDDSVLGGNVNIVGLHVTLTTPGAPSDVLAEGNTGQLGNVTFSIPASATSIAITNGTSGVDGGVGDCYVSQTVTRDLPLKRRDGWIYIHHSGATYPACGQ